MNVLLHHVKSRHVTWRDDDDEDDHVQNIVNHDVQNKPKE